MKRSPSGDVDTVRELVEEATTKGFRSFAIDRATTVVAKQDQQEKIFAFFTSLPGAVVDYVSTTSLDAADVSSKFSMCRGTASLVGCAPRYTTSCTEQLNRLDSRSLDTCTFFRESFLLGGYRVLTSTGFRPGGVQFFHHRQPLRPGGEHPGRGGDSDG